MKNRVAKKAERMILADKVCQLQREVCEYERFCGDLFLMIHKKDPHRMVIMYDTTSDMHEILWEKVRELVEAVNGTKFVEK